MGDQHGEGSDLRTASFGYWLRRRRLALDLTQAALARQVGCATSTIKKLEYDGRRPSRQMAERLADCLAIPAVEREAFVASGLGERPVDSLPVTTEPATAQAPPAWLRDADDADRPEVRFVGRESELAQLQGWLAEAQAGRGRVALIAGEAGRGKTALLAEFARLAQASQPDLIVAQGTCTAAAGLGDPYLPFHDILVTLAGDLEMRWQAGLLTADQARRLWDFAPHVAETILTDGPQLVDVLVPGRSLLRRPGTPHPGAATGAGQGNAQQSQLFEQVTAVLQALAQKRPLLLLVDDLQWADSASINLLFHLGRRLAGSRILFVGAYRPSEVAAGPEARSGVALQQIIREFGRLFGDMQLDLEHFDPAEARRLADALLDRELNRLDEPFRVKLFWQTHGHPLFLLELLRVLKAKGQLVRDAAGYWIESGTLDWQTLPGRVTAVIAQRLAPLDQQARRVLDVASVEGERFTAEAVAAVTGLEVGQLLHLLSRDLEQRHGLVREMGALEAGGRRLTRYQFSHVLFQQYLYEGLGMGERRQLHGRVAAEMEALHRADLEAVASPLAHHFAAAGLPERAIPYFIRGGDRARTLYAHQEAVEQYRRALDLLQAAGRREETARTWLKLGLAHQTAFDYPAAQTAFDEAFRLWPDLPAARPAIVVPPLRLVWQDPPSLDPTLGGYNLTAPVITQLFSGLVAYGPDNEIVPDVAYRWEIEDGGRRYIFHLRDDVTWSDGVPVTATDFAFTYRRALDPATGAIVAGQLLYAIRGAEAFHRGQTAGPEGVAIQAPDDHTLVFELDEPTSYFIHNLAYYVLLPVPRHQVERHGSNWAAPEHIVTNGPFRLAAWRPGQEMNLERNPAYHGPFAGNVAQVHLKLAAAPEAQEALYAAGELDVASSWFATTDEVARLRQRFPADYVERPSFASLYYYLDVTRPPFDDLRFRRALAMAIDREELARGLYQGYMRPATGGFVPPGMPGHTPNCALPYRVDAARQLLAAAGYPGGRGAPPISVRASPQRQAAGAYLQRQWRENLGLAVGLQLLQPLLPLETAPELPVITYGLWWADYPDPDNFLRVNMALDVPEWQDEDYQRLIELAGRTADQDERLQLYQQAEHILAEAAVLVPLVYQPFHLLLKPWVKEYPTAAVKFPGFWKDVVVEPH